MELRYFELQPGSASRLEKHEHEHYVIVRSGEGYAILGDVATEIGPGDVIYVGACLHQFVNRARHRLGFLFRRRLPRLLTGAGRPTNSRGLCRSLPGGRGYASFAVPPARKALIWVR